MAVDPNVTPLIIGTFFGNILLGINFLQAFQYFRRFPLDRALFKGLVAWVGFLIMLVSTEYRFFFRKSINDYATTTPTLIQLQFLFNDYATTTPTHPILILILQE